MTIQQDRTAASAKNDANDVDAVIVGAGFAGLYMLHRLRDLGLSARVFEAGAGVGGTWYWNRYPGARCDVTSVEYSYSFSKELEQEWDWSELMASQPEIERYLNHVADRFDLRRDITFDTRVTEATFDEHRDRWTVRTDRGDELTATYCIMATGCLSAPLTPNIPGMDTFTGVSVQTSLWPREGVELAGKRVALIGTGSSAVQATPEIAKLAQHLTVFQRTPAYTWPAMNRPLEDEERERIKGGYPELRERQRTSRVGISGGFNGALLEPPTQKLLDLSEAERLTALDQHGFAVTRMFADVATDMAANEAARALYGEMIRRVVQEPATAEALTPTDYPIGCKRSVIDTDYFVTFNRPNVSLVDLRQEPIIEVTAKGIRTATAEREFDVIVYATGFDAMTGALLRIDIRGRDGQRLATKWAAGPRNYLGLMAAGYPNLFTITGPGSPSVLSNMPVSIEQHVDWITGCLVYLRDRGLATIEPTEDAEDAWVDHVNTVAVGTMYTAPSCNSWYLGANVPGKVRQFMPYVGGVGAYREKCEDVTAAGYAGFMLSAGIAAAVGD
ncbi:MAG: flavin-containing monooxygenase [Dehalococcoidia bacterium]